MTSTIKPITADSIKSEQNLYDFFIVGSGPSGMTAALYAARAKLKTAIIEKSMPGGKLIKTASLENYSGIQYITGIDLALNMHQQINVLNIDQYSGEITHIKHISPYWVLTTSDNTNYYTRTLYIATGMKEKQLQISGESEYYGRGVSYCAICDGTLYKNHEVIVIGGGNSALDEALYLADIVQKVHLVHRRYEFRGDALTVEKIKNNTKIELHLNYISEEILADSKGVYALKVTSKDQDQHTKLIHAKCIFIYIGLLPENQFIPSNINICDGTSGGFITVNENMETNDPGLYAGGDIINKHLRQVITACNDGAVAAIAAKQYLTNDFKE